MVREKSGKSQGILLYSDCGHPEPFELESHFFIGILKTMF